MADKHFALKFLREETLPTAFCPGCGNGIVMNCFLKAVEELGFHDLSGFAFVSGIGCAAWCVSPYFKADSLHTTHGRPIAFASGLKLARPELNVVVISGDGDIAGIGGNHLIHAARRNMDLLVICINNFNYGMTGGQVGPTTLHGVITTTTPYGNPEYPFDLARLVESAGANFVARWTTVHVRSLINSIKKALKKEGFRFIEVVSQCPTSFGRRIGKRTGRDLMKWFKERSIHISKARDVREGEDVIIVGEFVDRDRPGFVRKIREIIFKVRRENV
ncbi:MAG: thiamine pyrophosphate-dependent enzyme [Candidatus Baldrarchaeia archaeon]